MLASTLAGGGEMGALMRAKDWTLSPLGRVEDWPQSLRTSVSLCLNSRFALLVWWGSDLVMLYNDAYRRILGNKHPAALGQPGRECWPEIWHIIGPMLEQAYVRGEATWSDDLLLLLDRDGYPEECYFTFSYSPIRDESGIVGVFTPVQETTSQVVRARRLKTLGELGTRATRLATADAIRSSVSILAQNRADVTFALYYERAARDGGFVLRAEAGLGDVALRDPAHWPLAEVSAERPLIEGRLDVPVPSTYWEVPVHTAAVLHVPLSSTARGVVVVGLSPRRRLGVEYREFLQTAASSIAAAINDAEAYESERRRAETLEQLDRAKTTFFNNISHEFRTPLTLLKAPLEELLATADARSAPRLEIAHRNAERLLCLVNALLDFSRLEAGHLAPRFESVDLASLTRDVAEGFRPLMVQAGLAYEVSCAGPSTVDVDVDMWERIVANLLSNAYKYTLEGRVSVRLTVADDEARLEVRDTGVGIASAHLPQIFDRFHRVPGVVARSAEGTGIGLALVAELVHLHGGTIGVESREGQGSVFRVRVPRAQATSTAPRPRAPGAGHLVREAERWGGSEAPSAGDGSGHVLVVDDNRDMRDYIAALLRERHRVTTAADGREGLRAAATDPPDVVLADVMMPQLDGFGLLASLRKDPALADIPVILISARAGEEARLEGLEAGADDYLVKPFSARELRARVRTQIEMSRLRRALLSVEREDRQAAEEAKRRAERLAEALQEHHDRLEIKVAERTRDLQEANARLMQVDRMKSEFIASVSHELRTPLNSIIGFTSLLLDDSRVAAEVKDYLSIVLAAGNDLLVLIEELLDLGRIEAGRARLHVEPVDLGICVPEAVESMRPVLERPQRRLTLRVAPVEVLTDRSRVRQILLNLLTNAEKFTERGEIEVVVERCGAGAAVVVRDTGVGMPAAALSALFQPFTQLGDVHPGKGTGLGLYLSKKLALLLGGDLSVSSTEGEGSAFTLWLPLEGPEPTGDD